MVNDVHVAPQAKPQMAFGARCPAARRAGADAARWVLRCQNGQRSTVILTLEGGARPTSD
eukprot:6201242-Pleurochrysis_carterae.AAC.2